MVQVLQFVFNVLQGSFQTHRPLRERAYLVKKAISRKQVRQLALPVRQELSQMVLDSQVASNANQVRIRILQLAPDASYVRLANIRLLSGHQLRVIFAKKASTPI